MHFTEEDDQDVNSTALVRLYIYTTNGAETAKTNERTKEP